jgi:valyl-tRNA synthetase
VASQKASSAIVETKGTAESGKAGGKVPQSSNSTQKVWTCALCSVTATSKKDLNSHLNGRKHRDASEAALKAKKQLALQKLKNYQSKEEVNQLNVSNKLNSNVKNGEDILNKGLKGTVMMDDKVQKLQKKVQKLQKNLCEPVGMHNSKLICSVCNVVLHCEANVASHLNGKMHLAKMQSKVDRLNNLRDICTA